MDFFRKIWNRVNNSVFNQFGAKDKREVLTLFALLVTILAVNWCIGRFGRTEMPTFDDETNAKLDLLDQRLAELKEGDTLSRLDRYIMQRYDTLQLFNFDPNTVTQAELLKLGFTEKQAGNLVNYRENGGRFRVPDDLRKLYGMRTMQFKILKPYIAIAGASNANDYQNSHTKKDNRYPDKSSDKSDGNDAKTAAKEYFEFDPNTITADEMMKLGFSEKQAASFINWREKGKKFYVARDFAAAYSVDEKRYKELEPYIKIDLPKLLGGRRMLDLNTASASELHDLGLTADDAASVIDCREKVGYYFANWQIEDALPKKRANELKASFYVCASVNIRKIDLNTTPPDLLEQHPYFNATQSAAVVKLRDAQPIKSIDDLKQTGAFSDKELNRIKNYLKF